MMSNHIWNEDRTISKDFCYECGSNNDIHFHHIIPVSLGGNETIPLCNVCHGKVHSHNISNKELQRKGIEIAKAKGKYKGRSENTKMTNDDIIQKYAIVANEIKAGQSLRKAAVIGDVSLCTAQRVKKAMGL